MHLLIVDDDEMTCLWIQKQIEEMHLRALTGIDVAFSAEEAMKVSSTKQTDILLTDIKMSEKDGLRLIREMKAVHPDIKSIIITAYASFEYAQEAISLGVKRFLLKPFKKEELEEAICDVIMELQSGEGVSPEDIMMDWVADYIEKNMDREINMSYVANHFNLSYSHFSHVFKKKTNQSFSDYVLKVKMHRAGELIKSSGSTQNVARQLGYGSPQNFNRAFKKYWKCTPSEFRDKNTKGKTKPEQELKTE